ncbi:uncharacterized protein LOC129748077 [Uranotaenia lowii]|uniref:uncharacterized protein LOC129748077 n=1 Tax=Uranotaenia lowii TaxID=190385 RepID=UPI00247AF10D|nr:uncharacterized protein LOC129748077 [Uranotaenia lowii]
MTYEKSDTFYDLDRIYSTIERMLVLIRQLSGVSRLGESGRSMSVELQLLNSIDDRSYQIEELQEAVGYLFGQFRKIYMVNKDLYVQLNKRGGRIFELEKQIRDQAETKCLYYMADVIKYEPSLLAMQRVLDRTMREIWIFRKQRNKHKLELCVSHVRNENYDKAFDEFFSFENSIEQLPEIVSEVFDKSIKNLIKLLLFLKGYYHLRKPNSEETFVTGCDCIVQYLKSSVMFRRVETLMIYSAVSEVLKEENHFLDFLQERLELILIDLSDNKNIAVAQIQHDSEESSEFAKLSMYISNELLIELIRRAYQGSTVHLKNILKFVSNISCISQMVLCYQELHSEMRRLKLSQSSSIFLFAVHLKNTMQSPKFHSSAHSVELEELRAILSPHVSSIVWKQVSISRHESRVLMKCGGLSKGIGFSRYTACKNRFELEPIEEGDSFRIRNVATNTWLVEAGGRLVVVGSKYDHTKVEGHWKLLPVEECSYFRIMNAFSGRYIYSNISSSEPYDFYNCPEMIKLTNDESVLNENNSNWKIEEFLKDAKGDSECVIL